MLRKLSLFLWCLTASFLFATTDLQATLQSTYDAALSLSVPETAELQLYDALMRLQEDAHNLGDLEVALSARTAESTPATVRTALEVIAVLQSAVAGDIKGYKTSYAQLQKTTTNAKMLAVADVTELLETCSSCNGKLRCTRCAGAMTCTTCKGRGKVRSAKSATASIRLDTPSLVSCSVCSGSGRCPTCKGAAKQCSQCQNSGKLPDEERVYARIQHFAGQLAEHLAKLYSDQLVAREQTTLLAEDLRKAQGCSNPSTALEMLTALPEARIQAVQWSHVVSLKAQLEAMIKDTTENSAQRQAQRRALRLEVQAAQRHPDVLKGMAQLLQVMEKYAECDALPEVKTAFDGLVVTYRQSLQQQIDDLQARKHAILLLQNPLDKIAQLEVLIASIESPEIPKALLTYAKQSHAELHDILKDRRLEDLRDDLLAQLALAQAQQKALEESGIAWWVWAIIGVGVLLVGYLLVASIQGAMARRAEAARQARERAALDSIRSTFSHRRGK